MTPFSFTTTIDCHLADGSVKTLRGYRVKVEAETSQAARDAVESIAEEMIHDAGSDLLDAPLEYIKLRSADRI